MKYWCFVHCLQVTIELKHFPEFKDDAAFASQMLREQSVFTIPGMVSDTQIIYVYTHYSHHTLIHYRRSRRQVALE